MKSVIVQSGLGSYKFSCRWRGKTLAVHAEAKLQDKILSPNKNKKDRLWTITHSVNGFSVGRFSNLKKAIAFARQWDSVFPTDINNDSIQTWEYTDLYCEERDSAGGFR